MLSYSESDGMRIQLYALRLAVLFGVIATAAAWSSPRAEFVLSSSDPRLLVSVPEEYTAKAFGCSGGNSSPPLQWLGVPAGTQSFVITLFDPDARSSPSGWWHWVIYDLPKDVVDLSKGAGAERSKSLPVGAMQGRTDL